MHSSCGNDTDQLQRIIGEMGGEVAQSAGESVSMLHRLMFSRGGSSMNLYLLAYFIKCCTGLRLVMGVSRYYKRVTGCVSFWPKWGPR